MHLRLLPSAIRRMALVMLLPTSFDMASTTPSFAPMTDWLMMFKKRKKKLNRGESIASTMHFQKPNNLMLLMATSLSAAHSSIWGHASHIISKMMLILKHNLLLRIKAWALWKRYGGIHILTPTASIFSSVQSQWTFSFGDVRIGLCDKTYYDNLKFFSTAASAGFSTSPLHRFRKSASEMTKFAICSTTFHVSPTWSQHDN